MLSGIILILRSYLINRIIELKILTIFIFILIKTYYFGFTIPLSNKILFLITNYFLVINFWIFSGIIKWIRILITFIDILILAFN